MWKRVKLRHQDDALLLIGVGSGDDPDALLSLACVDGKVRNAGRDVDEVAGLRELANPKSLAGVDDRGSAEDVDRGLVRLMSVSMRTPARRDLEEMHA